MLPEAVALLSFEELLSLVQVNMYLYVAASAIDSYEYGRVRSVVQNRLLISSK